MALKLHLSESRVQVWFQVSYKHKDYEENKIKCFNFLQNRRAKWRKREPPRKTGTYNLNPNSNQPPTITGTTAIHPIATTFATYQQPTTITSPGGSVDSWTNGYQYETHYNLLPSPASSPYGTYTHQYATPYEQQMFPTRHYEYDSPSRTNGILVDGNADSHHKTDYSSIGEDGNDA